MRLTYLETAFLLTTDLLSQELSSFSRAQASVCTCCFLKPFVFEIWTSLEMEGNGSDTLTATFSHYVLGSMPGCGEDMGVHDQDLIGANWSCSIYFDNQAGRLCRTAFLRV